MIVCIDTNVLPGMFGRAAPLLPLRRGLLAGRFTWALSTEILLEYEEIVAREMGDGAVERLMQFIEFVEQARGVIRRVSPSFRFHLIFPSYPSSSLGTRGNVSVPLPQGAQ